MTWFSSVSWKKRDYFIKYGYYEQEQSRQYGFKLSRQIRAKIMDKQGVGQQAARKKVSP